MSEHFYNKLIPQDRQRFKPHITVQNKVSSETSKALTAELSADFQPFLVTAVGLDLWEYIGGPWRHSYAYSFG